MTKVLVIIWSGASGKGLTRDKEKEFDTRAEAIAWLKSNMPARHYPIFRQGRYYSAIKVG